MNHWVGWVIAVALVAMIAWAYSACIDTEAVGFLHDDGVYVVTGQAIAEGHGPTLVHRPEQPTQVRYPLLYPLLLALGWKINPDFPANVPLLTWLTTAFSLGFLLLFFHYLRSVKGVRTPFALAAIALTATSYQYIVYSTMLMSELPYLFLSLVTLFYAERKLATTDSWQPVVITALLVAVSFHTRTVGLMLAAGIGLWLLLEKRWRDAALFGFVTGTLTVIPWFVWTGYNSPILTDVIDYPYIHPYGNYGFDFASRFTEHEYSVFGAFADGLVSFRRALLEGMFPGIPNLLQILPVGNDLAANDPWVWRFVVAVGALGFLLLGFFAMGGVLAIRRRAVTMSGLYVAIYSLLIICWNYEKSTPRFLIVVLPWLWLYILKPTVPQWGRGLLQRRQAPVWLRPIAVLFVVLITAYPAFLGYRFIRDSRAHHAVADPQIAGGMWREYQHAYQYIREELPESAVIGAHSDPPLYLYTRRPTFYVHYDGLRIIDGRHTDQSHVEMLASMDRYGVRYLMVEPEGIAPSGEVIPNQVAMHILKTNPHRFRWIHGSPKGTILFYEILPKKQAEESPPAGG